MTLSAMNTGDLYTTGFTIVEQTDEYILLDKSAGIAMHKDTEVAGLVMQVCQVLGVSQLFPVHRLDKMTSGLVLMARSAEAASILSRQFQVGTVEKYYLALSHNKPQKKQGLIKGDMVKARRGSWKLTKTLATPAITQFFSCSVAPGLRLFLLRPHTGKTHQLRVAMKSIGAPIAGDSRYGAVKDAGAHSRGYLHAWQLSFDWAGQRRTYRCAPRSGDLFVCDAVQQQLIDWAPPESLPWPTIARA